MLCFKLDPVASLQKFGFFLNLNTSTDHPVVGYLFDIDHLVRLVCILPSSSLSGRFQ